MKVEDIEEENSEIEFAEPNKLKDTFWSGLTSDRHVFKGLKKKKDEDLVLKSVSD